MTRLAATANAELGNGRRIAWAGRRVAVKLLRHDVASDFDASQRFLQQARSATAIEHPNVVEVLDMGRYDEWTVYMVFELLRGQSLADRLDAVGLLDQLRLNQARFRDGESVPGAVAGASSPSPSGTTSTSRQRQRGCTTTTTTTTWARREGASPLDMAYTRPVHPDPKMHRELQASSRVSLTEPVRGYEMGQDGCLPCSGFARYFEHMRWELGRRGHRADPEMPKRGVVRAQTHRYLAELRFPNVWTGRTHLIHVGGSSLHYGHDITREDGQVLVRARTVVVLLDGSNRPAAAPGYLRDYVDTSLEAPAPLSLPEPSWTGTPAYTVHVRPSDQDSFGHVNQARYIDFVDDARRAAGLSPMRAVTLGYERETLAGDTLAVQFGPATAVPTEPSVARRAFQMVRASDGVVVHHGVIEVATESEG